MHNSLSVGEALELPELREAKLLAGSAGLDAAITHVTVLEVPEAIRFMQGGEFLLTGGYAFTNDPTNQDSILSYIKNKGVSAIAIKSGRFFDTIPEFIINKCENLGLPLVELPPPMTYRPVMIALTRAISGLNVLRWAEELEQLLTPGAEFEVQDLCRWIELRSGQPCLVVDTRGNIHAGDRGQRYKDCIAEKVDWLKRRGLREKAATFSVNCDGKLISAVCFTVHFEGAERILLILICQNSETVAVDLPLGHVGAGLIAHLLEERENLYLERADRILQALGVINKPLEDMINATFRFFALDLNEGFRVFVSSLHPGRNEDVVRLWRRHLEEGYISFIDGGKVVGIIPDTSDVDSILTSLAKSAHSIGKKAWFGVGKSYKSCHSIKDSYKEAESSLAIALQGPAGGVVAYEDLGILHVLSEVKQSEPVKRLVERYVEPLIEYDEVHRSNLLGSLQVYLNSDRKLRAAARTLFVGKTTLAYRLRKIQDLIAVDLDNPTDVLNLQVALLAKNVTERLRE